MPFHGSAGPASRNRFTPSVAAPYGMPLKTRIPSLIAPRTRPRDVSAMAVCGSGFLGGTATAGSASPRLSPEMLSRCRRVGTPLSASGERHFGGHDRNELHVGFEREIGHESDLLPDVVHVHAWLDRHLAIRLHLPIGRASGHRRGRVANVDL